MVDLEEIRKRAEKALNTHNPFELSALTLKLLGTDIPALLAALDAKTAEVERLHGETRLVRMRCLNLLAECDERVFHDSAHRYTIPWGQALLLRQAVNAFDNKDAEAANAELTDLRRQLGEFRGYVERAADGDLFDGVKRARDIIAAQTPGG